MSPASADAGRRPSAVGWIDAYDRELAPAASAYASGASSSVDARAVLVAPAVLHRLGSSGTTANLWDAGTDVVLELGTLLAATPLPEARAQSPHHGCHWRPLTALRSAGRAGRRCDGVAGACPVAGLGRAHRLRAVPSAGAGGPPYGGPGRHPNRPCLARCAQWQCALPRALGALTWASGSASSRWMRDSRGRGHRRRPAAGAPPPLRVRDLRVRPSSLGFSPLNQQYPVHHCASRWQAAAPAGADGTPGARALCGDGRRGAVPLAHQRDHGVVASWQGCAAALGRGGRRAAARPRGRPAVPPLLRRRRGGAAARAAAGGQRHLRRRRG